MIWSAPDAPGKMTSNQFRIQYPNKAATVITVRFPKTNMISESMGDIKPDSDLSEVADFLQKLN